MSERLTAQFDGKSVCAFEMLGPNGQCIESVRSEMRLRSQAGQLFCPDCGGQLVLCAGAIREPYFRHYALEDCKATIAMRTKAGKRKFRCRRILYELAKGSGAQNLTMEEGKETVLCPILFDAEITESLRMQPGNMDKEE